MTYDMTKNISAHIGGRDIPLSSFMFSAGEIQVRISHAIIPLLKAFPGVPIVVRAHLRSSHDIMALFLLLDAFSQLEPKRRFSNRIDLIIPYFPYARQDRACAAGESYASALIARLLAASQPSSHTIVRSLTVWDIHSDRSIPSRAYPINNIPAKQLAYDLLVKHPDYIIVRPDAGAEERAVGVATVIDAPVIRMEKTRNPETGQLSGFKFVDRDSVSCVSGGCPLLIVDDICDGGRTFNGIVKEIHSVDESAVVDLYVTHGIFSAGFEHFCGIRHIYIANNVNGIELPKGFVSLIDPEKITDGPLCS